jgi:hypothetical protein
MKTTTTKKPATAIQKPGGRNAKAKTLGGETGGNP